MDKRSRIRKLSWFFIFAAFCTVSALLRFYLLGQVPNGLNHDEASIGYDALCLARYGIDRNGYPWPVYPITWGSGGGSPLMIYLVVLSTRLLGRSIFSLRFFPALLGSLTPLLLGLIPFLNKSTDTDITDLKEQSCERKVFSLLLIFLTAINPWHLMLSRWALDANTLPFFLTLAILLFVYAACSTVHRLPKYLLSSCVFALCPYAYGSATIVIPVLLLLLAAWSVKNRLMTIREMLLSALVFALVMAPLVLFFAVNALHLPAIITPYFSIPTLTASRSVFRSAAQLPATLAENLRYLLVFFTIGAEQGEISCNYVPGYAQMFRFTFPLTFLGLFLSIKSIKKRSISDISMLLLTGVTVLFSLFIELDINRMTLLLIPLIWFQARALAFLCTQRGLIFRLAACLSCAAVLCAGCLFLHDYFGEKYNRISKEEDFFMPGYEKAAQEAAILAGNSRSVVSTYTHLSAPFILALYGTETPPEEFLSTVVWKDESSEFRVASAFGRFSFGLPADLSDIDLDSTVLILHSSELDSLPDTAHCTVSTYGDFCVISR